ncbi:hypothetical protein U1Q18_015141 [Sarracenia purpurea var. burkii]
MQPRRYEDRTIPSDPKLKLRGRGIEFGHDPYAVPRLDFPERSPRSRRSLSPRQVEGSRRLLGVDGRNSSVERRDFGGGRGERIRSRSPQFGLVNKRSRLDEGVPSNDFPKRYEFVDRVDMSVDVSTGLKPDYRDSAKLIREKEFDGRSLSGTSGHGISSQKLMVSEDDSRRDLFRPPKDFGPRSKYGEGGGKFSSSFTDMDIGQFNDERARNPGPLPFDKLTGMDSYREREKPMFYSRDSSYPQLPVSRSKDYIGSSSGVSRANFQGLYQDGMALLTDEYPRSSAKLTEPSGFSGYVQRSSLDSGRDPKMEHKDMPHYWRDTFSPSRADQQDYLNHRPRAGDSDIYGHPSDELYRRMRKHEQVEYDQKDLVRPGVRHPIAEYADNTYGSRNLTGSSFLNRPSMQKKSLSNYLGANVSTTSKGEEYLDYGSARLDFGRRVSDDLEIPHLGVSKDQKISRLRLDYGFERDADPVSHHERMRNSPELEYDAEMRRLAVRTYGIKAEEHGMHESSDRAFKRKYNTDEEMSRRDSRHIISDKRNNTRSVRNPNDRDEDWTGQDSSVSFSTKRVGYENKLYQREKRKFDEAGHHRASASEDWLPSDEYDYVEDVQYKSTKPYKPGGRYSKGNLRSGSQSSYKPYHFNKRHVLPKLHNVWIRGKEDNPADMQENEDDQSEDWVSYAKSEPPEGSEEFKQLVHKAFLIFSKRLNKNPAVQKRYKEQGRAGSLFCVVCGKSTSKEFMDTQRLVTHAFMSHKGGLRAQHLGLHKAICVLLGWNSVVPPNVITWVPEAATDDEATAQKEDLILWPPVVIIHNTSIEENNVEEQQKVTTLEAIGDFLRGKGFSGGNFNTRLGKSANHNNIVTIVKFLGTFSGLQDAERLHKYFVENKCGRADFDRVVSSSSKGKSISNKEQGHKLELVLYGYMGIAEDLCKVDLDTKYKCLIKSKKEIQELANDPVKPE